MVIFSIDEWICANVSETKRWHEWFRRNPAALDVGLDIAQAKNVRELVLHIIAVDLRYAERLCGKEVTPYEQMPQDPDELFTLANETFERLRKYAQQAAQADLRSEIEFQTRSAGTLKASKRKILIHTLMHSIRHWAQLATALRQAGFKTDWQHDLLFSDVIE
jgi:uncharacterized damage-inducible protein DinB